jgi:hypothetical protein
MESAAYVTGRMGEAYKAANNLEALGRAIASRGAGGLPLQLDAARLRLSLILAGSAQPADRVIYLTAARRLARTCAARFRVAFVEGRIRAEEHHAARESLVRLLRDTPRA